MQETLKKADVARAYSVEEAVALAKDTSIAKPGATAEVVYKLNVGPRKTGQQIRGAVVFPNGTGKTQTVLAFVKGEKAKEIETVGTDFAGSDNMVAKIQGRWSNFDIVVTTPDTMVTVGKLGRILGPKGLMLNPRTGTVIMDVTKAVEGVKAGKVIYRVGKAGNIHVPIGKVSFDNEKLVESFNIINGVLLKVKPSTAKGRYVKSISVATTSRLGIHVDQASF